MDLRQVICASMTWWSNLTDRLDLVRRSIAGVLVVIAKSFGEFRVESALSWVVSDALNISRQHHLKNVLLFSLS